MANVHAGRIGDVWKHGPLVEILDVLAPSWYVETHAGSADYPWPDEPETDYGVTRVVTGAEDVPVLASAPYLDRLRAHASQPEPRFPGSPLLAMEQLGERARYVFSDIDPESVQSIQAHADRLGLGKRVDADIRDGLTAAREWLARERDSSGLLFIDPYQPFEPGLGSEITPLQLFTQATAEGVSALLWYGFDGDDRAEVHQLLDPLWREGFADRLWCGEVVPKYLEDDDFDFHTGYVGSGILTANLPAEATTRVAKYARGLERLYATAEIAGRPASLTFETPFG